MGNRRGIMLRSAGPGTVSDPVVTLLAMDHRSNDIAAEHDEALAAGSGHAAPASDGDERGSKVRLGPGATFVSDEASTIVLFQICTGIPSLGSTRNDDEADA